MVSLTLLWSMGWTQVSEHKRAPNESDIPLMTLSEPKAEEALNQPVLKISRH